MVEKQPFFLARQAYRRLPRSWTAGLDLWQRARNGGMREPARLDVMTSFGGRNIDVIQVLLLSLSETHRNDRIVFWFLELRVPPQRMAELAQYCETLGNVALRPIKIPHVADFDRLRDLGGKPDSARFLWLVAHRHLPDEVKRVIYLDALDTLVCDDLLPFLNHPFLGNYIVACREALDRPPLIIGPARRAHARGARTLTIRRMSRGLMNSGSIVLNLDKMRRDGLEIGDYLEVAQWARTEHGLSFGDQGLFSLTHGSHYALAHDCYNHRFFNAPSGRTMRHPAVIHYAGTMPKPFEWRLSSALEDRIAAHLARARRWELILNRSRAWGPPSSRITADGGSFAHAHRPLTGSRRWPRHAPPRRWPRWGWGRGFSAG